MVIRRAKDLAFQWRRTALMKPSGSSISRATHQSRNSIGSRRRSPQSVLWTVVRGLPSFSASARTDRPSSVVLAWISFASA